jgi:hypothetical protein
MKLQTLKELIEIEYNRCASMQQFKGEVFRLLEMYDRDMLNNVVLPIPPIDNVIKDTPTNPYEVKFKQAEWASK